MSAGEPPYEGYPVRSPQATVRSGGTTDRLMVVQGVVPLAGRRGDGVVPYEQRVCGGPPRGGRRG